MILKPNPHRSRRSRTRSLLGLGLLSTLVLLPHLASADDYFLKIENPAIAGESTDRVHSNEIELMTWSWGIDNSFVIPAPVGTGKTTLQTLKITMRSNKGSAPIALACANGDTLGKVTLTARKTGRSPLEYVKLTLTNARVVHYDQTALSSSERPIESVSIIAEQVQQQYVPQKADGTGDTPVKMGWDFIQNKKVQSTPAGSTPAAALNSPTTLGQVFGQNVTVSDPLETILNGQKYLSVEVTGPRLVNSGVRAETSENLKHWFGAGILEQTLTIADDSTTIRYSIPMDKAQQFLRVVQ